MPINCTELKDWFHDAFENLPGCDDVLFLNVWEKRLLQFDGKNTSCDAIDYYSARLVSAALKQSKPLLLTLPDYRTHRPALLFATALIRLLLDSLASDNTGRPNGGYVLYFGGAVGIRDQLRRTTVKGFDLKLAEAFSQEDISRGATGKSKLSSKGVALGPHLPRVVTVYGPADPAQVIRSYKPSLVAVDYEDSASVVWSRTLLEETKRNRIPLLAWGQNPLADCWAEFENVGECFAWPVSTDISPVASAAALKRADRVFFRQQTTRVNPLILQGDAITQFSSLMHTAGVQLAKSMVYATGPLNSDAIAVHWRYYRALENLVVPLDFYEAEATRHWGMQPFGKLAQICNHFQSACRPTSPLLSKNLEESLTYLTQALEHVKQYGCPLWEAMCDLCVDDHANNDVPILVFPSSTRKRLFEFAMLARQNTSEDNLNAMGVYLASLADIGRWMHHKDQVGYDPEMSDPMMPPLNSNWRPILVGVPSTRLDSKLTPVFRHTQVDVLLYPHQRPAIDKKRATLDIGLGGHPDTTLNSLGVIAGEVLPDCLYTPEARVTLDSGIELNVRSSQKLHITVLSGDPIWSSADPVSEVSKLFESQEDAEDNPPVSFEEAESGEVTISESRDDTWCTEFIVVNFDQGWRARIAADERINVISSGTLEERYVRALRPGDRVLFIHGQQRQSLYELIISRIHRNPQIELHLALIRRWQDEIKLSFARWRAHEAQRRSLFEGEGFYYDELLRQLRSRGSSLTSALAVRFWLQGMVLCPLDPEDLLRVAEVLDMSFVKRHHAMIAKAASRLRGIHRGLANKLGHWLRDHAIGQSSQRDDEVIDGELGLTFGDIRTSLLILNVRSIENIHSLVLRSSLGHLEKDV